LSLEEQIRRIAGVKSEFERLLSKDEINLDQNAARKAWAEECVRDAYAQSGNHHFHPFESAWSF
jgi:hypothetical protein